MTNTDRLAQALLPCPVCGMAPEFKSSTDRNVIGVVCPVEGEPVAWAITVSDLVCDVYKNKDDGKLEFDRRQKMYPDTPREFVELYTAAQVAALTAQCEADTRDAKLWRALLSCKRIRILGTAGFGDGNINGLGHYRHFGAEFWTRYGEDVKDAFDGAQVITEFATEAAAIAAGNGEGGA